MSRSSLLKLVHFSLSVSMYYLSSFFLYLLFSFFFLFSVSFSLSDANFITDSVYCISISDKYLEHQSSNLYWILPTNISFPWTVVKLNNSFRKEDIPWGRPFRIFSYRSDLITISSSYNFFSRHYRVICLNFFGFEHNIFWYTEKGRVTLVKLLFVFHLQFWSCSSFWEMNHLCALLIQCLPHLIFSFLVSVEHLM